MQHAIDSAPKPAPALGIKIPAFKLPGEIIRAAYSTEQAVSNRAGSEPQAEHTSTTLSFYNLGTTTTSYSQHVLANAFAATIRNSNMMYGLPAVV